MISSKRSSGLLRGVVDQAVAVVGARPPAGRSRAPPAAASTARVCRSASANRSTRFGHSSLGRKLTNVSTMSSGAGSVGRVGPAGLADDRFHLGEAAQQGVAGLEVVGRPAVRLTPRHGDRHVQSAALVQGRHEVHADLAGSGRPTAPAAASVARRQRPASAAPRVKNDRQRRSPTATTTRKQTRCAASEAPRPSSACKGNMPAARISSAANSPHDEVPLRQAQVSTGL